MPKKEEPLLPPPDPICVAQVLERAVEKMDELGWCQGELVDYEGAVCAIGSINATIFGNDLRKIEKAGYKSPRPEFLKDPKKRLQAAAIEAVNKVADMDIVVFNDEYADGKTDVQRVFKKAAKELRKKKVDA